MALHEDLQQSFFPKTAFNRDFKYNCLEIITPEPLQYLYYPVSGPIELNRLYYMCLKNPENMLKRIDAKLEKAPMKYKPNQLDVLYRNWLTSNKSDIEK